MPFKYLNGPSGKPRIYWTYIQPTFGKTANSEFGGGYRVGVTPNSVGGMELETSSIEARLESAGKEIGDPCQQ